MPNTQLISKPHYRTDGAVFVHSIFRTIQGEGPFAGHPAVFVRLNGCNLQCPLCDTEYSNYSELMSVSALAKQVRIHSKHPMGGGPESPGRFPDCKLVVFTGGEPFRQDFSKIADELLDLGFTVQVETNGTLRPPVMLLHGRFHIVCSPKTAKIGLDDDCIDAWKYVLQEGKISAEDGLPTQTLGMPCGAGHPYRPASLRSVPIYVQPLDEKDLERNELNLTATINSALKFNYILGLQSHKIAELP